MTAVIVFPEILDSPVYITMQRRGSSVAVAADIAIGSGDTFAPKRIPSAPPSAAA